MKIRNLTPHAVTTTGPIAVGAQVHVDQECVPEDWGTAGEVTGWDGQSCIVTLATGHLTEVLPDQLTKMV